MLMDSKRILGTTPLLTKADCLSEKPDDFKNQLLIIRSSLLTPKFRYAEFQYFYAIGVSGDRVTGFYLADEAPSEIDRLGFHGSADPKKLPKWAAERLAEILSPKMKIRIFQVDHDKDPQRLAYEPLKDLPNGIVNASMYRQVYGGTVNCGSLDEVFARCNSEDRPPGYCGESMSVGNVVEICSGEKKGYYFCDRTGFPKIDFDISQTDHDQMLTVLICEPNKEPYQAEIRDCLRAKQSIVGGLIEPVYFTEKDNVLAFCDEEFLFKGYAPNRVLGGRLIHGPFFIVGDAYNDEGEKIEVSLSAEQLAKFASDFCYPLVDISDNAVAEEPEESEALDFSQT